MKKSFHKFNQFLGEKTGYRTKTVAEQDFAQICKETEAMSKYVEEIIDNTLAFLQPNPTTRALLKTKAAVSKLKGDKNQHLYPQPETNLGNVLVKTSEVFDEENTIGRSIRLTGDHFVDLGENRHRLEEQLKQNFLQPLDMWKKDFKEATNHKKKYDSRRLTYDALKSKEKPEVVELRLGKMREAQALTEKSMINVLDQEVEHVSQLFTLVSALLTYHQNAVETLERLLDGLKPLLNEATMQPKRELSESSAEILANGVSGSSLKKGSMSSSVDGLNCSDDSDDDPSADPWALPSSSGGKSRGRGGASGMRGPPPAYEELENESNSSRMRASQSMENIARNSATGSKRAPVGASAASPSDWGWPPTSSSSTAATPWSANKRSTLNDAWDTPASGTTSASNNQNAWASTAGRNDSGQSSMTLTGSRTCDSFDPFGLGPLDPFRPSDKQNQRDQMVATGATVAADALRQIDFSAKRNNQGGVTLSAAPKSSSSRGVSVSLTGDQLKQAAQTSASVAAGVASQYQQQQQQQQQQQRQTSTAVESTSWANRTSPPRMPTVIKPSSLASRPAPPVPGESRAAPVTAPPVETLPRALAVYAFAGETETDLSFNENDLIYLTRRIDDNWLEGSLQIPTGSERRGMFPASYVQVIKDI